MNDFQNTGSARDAKANRARIQNAKGREQGVIGFGSHLRQSPETDAQLSAADLGETSNERHAGDKTMITTTLGTWLTMVDSNSLSPEMTYLTCVEAGDTDGSEFDMDATLTAYFAAIKEVLPEGVVILGNGEILADVSAPDFDYDELVTDLHNVEWEFVEK